MRNVFLSYAQRDAKSASALQREFAKLGVRAFDPADIKPGDDWRKSILGAIHKAETVIVLLSRPSDRAPGWIGYEVGAAAALGKNILVLKSPDIAVGDLPQDLAGIQTMDLDPRSYAKLARDLIEQFAVPG